MERESTDNLSGQGLYTLGYASKLAGMKRDTISRWLYGYQRKDSDYEPVKQPNLRNIGNHRAAGFLDLMELRVIQQFLARGVSLQTIRKAARKARALIKHDHPFSTRIFKTDGRSIFADLQPHDDKDAGALLEVVSSQWVFEDVVGPSLHDLDYPDQNEASSPYQWWAAGRDRQVIVDPRKSFGMPLVREGWVPTAILANQAKVNGVDRTAELYQVSKRGVLDAVSFEDQFAA